MEIRNLKNVNTSEILNAFNEAFSDYFVPLKLTTEQLTAKMFADKIDFSLSVGAFENKKLVAFILHGLDTNENKKIAYNGGTGVIPEQRGAGLTKRMYQYVLPLLAEKGIDKIVLEVIDKNVQAIKSYEKSGFKIKRNLACYKGDFNIQNTNKDVEIRALQDYPWNVMQSFWDIEPSFQNSINVVEELKSDTVSLGAYLNNKLVGYVVYNPSNKRIHQIATKKNHRKKGIASSLIHVITEQNGNSCSIINIDKKSKNTLDFLNSLGLKSFLEQIEMELDINQISF